MKKFNIYKFLRVSLLMFPLVLVAFAVFRSGVFDPDLFEEVLNSLHLPIGFFKDVFTSFYEVAFGMPTELSHAFITYLSYICIVELSMLLVRVPLVIVDLFNLVHNKFKGDCDV